MPLSWQDRLDTATTEGDVVAVAKDFVAQFSPQEINRLPKTCRPGKFFDGNDVTAYAFALMRHDCDEVEVASELVHRLVAFFSNASARLTRIMARPNPSEASTRQSA